MSLFDIIFNWMKEKHLNTNPISKSGVYIDFNDGWVEVRDGWARVITRAPLGLLRGPELSPYDPQFFKKLEKAFYK